MDRFKRRCYLLYHVVLHERVKLIWQICQVFITNEIYPMQKYYGMHPARLSFSCLQEAGSRGLVPVRRSRHVVSHASLQVTTFESDSRTNKSCNWVSREQNDFLHFCCICIDSSFLCSSFLCSRKLYKIVKFMNLPSPGCQRGGSQGCSPAQIHQRSYG